ncbi:unnamed protein product [Didymodactylos carnosus]|uniref:Uncharacterized protein n=1 Tax=Didymodactylos carnosus TaxID=1234261 RepID=A0A8S2CSB0_9BILA|nr:unnamed protein product [Didymodactylos carnosus]CAF3528767.1 unnamed protein product [Didymodactylos carnosus]
MFPDYRIEYAKMLLVCISWQLALSMDSMKAKIAKLLSIHIIIYPLLLNFVEVKVNDYFCPSIKDDYAIDGCYVIQQAVSNKILIRNLNITIFSFFITGCILFIIYFIWNIRQHYKYSTKYEDLDNDESLPLNETNHRQQQEYTNQILNEIKVLKDLVEMKERESSPVSPNTHFVETETMNECIHRWYASVIFFPVCQGLVYVYLISAGIPIIYFFLHILFSPKSLSSSAVYTTSLFNPIKYNNEFTRKQLIDFSILIFIGFVARALRFFPYKQPRNTSNVMWKYVKSIFWNCEGLIQRGKESFRQRLNHHEQRPRGRNI